MRGQGLKASFDSTGLHKPNLTQRVLGNRVLLSIQIQMILFLLLALFLTSTNATKILIIGDSMGAFSNNFLGTYCKDATVVNKAISGSTAYQWAQKADSTYEDLFSDGGGGFTHVWISLLGNDWMTPGEDTGAPGASSGGCEISTADMKSRLSPVLIKIRSAATKKNGSSVKMVFTSYCVPAEPECNGKTDSSDLTQAFTELANENSDVEFADISTQCGGSMTKTGDRQYFVDQIHLNQRGYCKAFGEYQSVQTAFSCPTATFECSQAPRCGGDGTSEKSMYCDDTCSECEDSASFVNFSVWTIVIACVSIGVLL
eukprot:g2324.t1